MFRLKESTKTYIHWLSNDLFLFINFIILLYLFLFIWAYASHGYIASEMIIQTKNYI